VLEHQALVPAHASEKQTLRRPAREIRGEKSGGVGSI
jgi:hypothetical protein